MDGKIINFTLTHDNKSREFGYLYARSHLTPRCNRHFIGNVSTQHNTFYCIKPSQAFTNYAYIQIIKFVLQGASVTCGFFFHFLNSLNTIVRVTVCVATSTLTSALSLSPTASHFNVLVFFCRV